MIRARMSDLRKAGLQVEARKRDDGRTGFVLVADGTLGLR